MRAEDLGSRFLVGPAIPLGTAGEIKAAHDAARRASEPKWELVVDGERTYLLYSGPPGARCFRLDTDGGMVDVTDAVVPEGHRYGKAGPEARK